MSIKVKAITAEYENGNILMLQLKEKSFAGNKPVAVWEISFGEKIPGNHENVTDDEPPTEDPHFFNIHQCEYFPQSLFDEAKKAFDVRLKYNTPWHLSCRGYSFNQISEILIIQARNETMPPDTEHTVFKEDWYASLPD